MSLKMLMTVVFIAFVALSPSADAGKAIRDRDGNGMDLVSNGREMRRKRGGQGFGGGGTEFRETMCAALATAEDTESSEGLRLGRLCKYRIPAVDGGRPTRACINPSDEGIDDVIESKCAKVSGTTAVAANECYNDCVSVINDFCSATACDQP